MFMPDEKIVTLLLCLYFICVTGGSTNVHTDAIPILYRKKLDNLQLIEINVHGLMAHLLQR